MENFSKSSAWFLMAKYTALAAVGFGLICAVIFIVGMAGGHSISWR